MKIDFSIEMAVISLCLKNPKNFSLVSQLGVEEAYFTNKNISVIFAAMKSLFNDGRSIDLPNVGEKLRNMGMLGDYSSLQTYLELPGPTEANINEYVSTLREGFNQKKLQEFSAFVAKTNNEKLSSQEKRDLILNHFMDFDTEQKKDTFNLLEDFDSVDDFEEDEYVETGIPYIDDEMPIAKKSVVVVSGPTGSGKSLVVDQFMTNIAKKGNKVLFLSLEMSFKKMRRRHVQKQTGFQIKNLKTISKEKVQEINNKVKENLPANFLYRCPSHTMTLNEVISMIRIEHHKSPLTAVAIDYIQLIENFQTGKSKALQVAEISTKLTQLSVELNIVMFFVAQLNRNMEMRQNSRPSINDIAESSQIAKDATLVLFIYHGEMKKIDAKSGHKEVELIVAKSRDGEMDLSRMMYLDGLHLQLHDAPNHPKNKKESVFDKFKKDDKKEEIGEILDNDPFEF